MQEISEHKYPEIRAKRKNGNEIFLNTGLNSHTLSDFWAWAYSDLTGNTERGKLAEYIVGLALGVTDTVSKNWSNYDLISAEGIRIEVKSSAYIQSWSQNNLSKIVFDIKETHAWTGIGNEYESERKRQSDVYVFCIFNNTEQATINPLDMSQWSFFICPTAVLNEKAKTQKSITLKKLAGIGAKECKFSTLYDTIRENVFSKNDI